MSRPKSGHSEKAAQIKRNILLIIDPQIDFHPEGGSGITWLPQGILAIPAGANEDSLHIAAMLK